MSKAFTFSLKKIQTLVFVTSHTLSKGTNISFLISFMDREILKHREIIQLFLQYLASQELNKNFWVCLIHLHFCCPSNFIKKKERELASSSSRPSLFFFPSLSSTFALCSYFFSFFLFLFLLSPFLSLFFWSNFNNSCEMACSRHR